MTLRTDRQLRKNIIIETSKAFGDITNTYATLVDLGENNILDHLSLESDLDKEISLKFLQSGKEITLTDLVFVYDDFAHGGIIQVKYNGDAPTSGSLKLRSW